MGSKLPRRKHKTPVNKTAMQMPTELKCARILIEMQIALTVKLMENAKRNSEMEKKAVSAPVGDVG